MACPGVYFWKATAGGEFGPLQSRNDGAYGVFVVRHLLTGIGAYYYLTWGIWLRHCLNGRQDEYSLVWPRLLSLPEIVRSDYTSDIVQPEIARKVQ